MKNKTFVAGIAILLIFGSAGFALAAPNTIFQRNILPETNNTYDFGSTTPALQWANIFTQNLYVSTGGGSGTRCAQFDNNGKLSKAAAACGSGGGSGGGSWSTTTSSVAGVLVNYPNNSTDVVVIGDSSTTTAPYWIDPNILRAFFSGNFGISTTSPYRPLSVSGSGVFGNDVRASTFTATSSASIPALSNLTSNGFVKTSGGVGTLSVDTTSYTADSRTITVAGTANQVTSSAGAQDLSANRTWTLSLPNHVIFPSSFQVTYSTSTNATSTNQAITNLLTFNGVTGSTWASFCTSITGSADLCDGSDATGGGGGAFPFTSTTNFNQTANATTTALWLQGSPFALFASSTSVFANASSTNLTVSGSSWFTGVTASRSLAVDSTGKAYGVATSTQTLSASFSTTGTMGDLLGGTSGTLSVVTYFTFTIATTTSWTGTTTIPLGPAYVAETWNGVQCFTDAGTLNVDIYYSSTHLALFNASTTVGTVTWSSNNTPSASNKRYVDVGTPASSPKYLSCTVKRTI